MKTLFMILCCTALAFVNPVQAQQTLESGTYYIVNLATGRALTPVDGGIHSNTRLKVFKKSGMQKWNIKKQVTKSKNGTEQISYSIQNASSSFYLRPHHVPQNGNAILSSKDTYCSFRIEADEENFILKNIKMGGDAMFSKNTGFSDDEPWFGADEAEDNFRWRLIPVDE